MTLGLRSTLAAPEECGPYLLSNSPNECTLPAPGLRLLCVGNDAVLLESRTKVLQQAGYVVKPCTSSAANFWVRDGQFDATLVCRSVTLEQGATIASEAHARGQMKVFRLASPNGNTETPYDGHIDMSGGRRGFCVI